MGITPTVAPSGQASSIRALRALWTNAGLELETRTVEVRRGFDNSTISGT
jgi:hypothetical protein